MNSEYIKQKAFQITNMVKTEVLKDVVTNNMISPSDKFQIVNSMIINLAANLLYAYDLTTEEKIEAYVNMSFKRGLKDCVKFNVEMNKNNTKG